MTAISAATAKATGKPERYMMIMLERAEVCLGGEHGPGAFVDVRGIGGLTPEVNKALSESISGALETELGIPPERVYLTFTDVAATNWGWRGSTFG